MLWCCFYRNVVLCIYCWVLSNFWHIILVYCWVWLLSVIRVLFLFTCKCCLLNFFSKFPIRLKCVMHPLGFLHTNLKFQCIWYCWESLVTESKRIYCHRLPLSCQDILAPNAKNKFRTKVKMMLLDVMYVLNGIILLVVNWPKYNSKPSAKLNLSNGFATNARQMNALNVKKFFVWIKKE